MADVDLTAELAEKLKAWRSVTDAPAIPGAPKDWLVTELDRWFLVTARTAMPALLAAVEAVLELADGWKREVARLEPSGADAVQPAKPGNYLVSGRIGALEDCTDALREVITRKITGKGESDGH